MAVNTPDNANLAVQVRLNDRIVTEYLAFLPNAAPGGTPSPVPPLTSDGSTGTILVGQSLSLTSLTISPFVQTHETSPSIPVGVTLNTLNTLALAGTLVVANGVTLNGTSAGIVMQGGTLSLGALSDEQSAIMGHGLISATAGSVTNAGLLYTADGTLAPGDSWGLVVGGPGGLANLSGSTLSGGSYVTNGQTPLFLKGDGLLVTDSAKIYLNGGTDAAFVASYDAANGAYLPLQESLQTIAPGGVLSVGRAANFASSQTVTVQGWLDVSSSGSFSASGIIVASGGTLSLAPASITSRPNAALGQRVVSTPITNNGTVLVAAYGATTPVPFGLILAIARPIISADVIFDENAAITGNGTIDIGTIGSSLRVGNTLELRAAMSGTVKFSDATSTLVIAAPYRPGNSSFGGTIQGFTSGDSIVLSSFRADDITDMAYSGDTAGGVLTFSASKIAGTSESFSLRFTGDYSNSRFLLIDSLASSASGTPAAVITQASATGTPTIAAGSGAQFLTLPFGAVSVTSGGANTISASAGTPTISAGSGNPLVFGNAATLTFVGGSGAASVVGGAGSNTIFGGSGRLLLFGTTRTAYIGGTGAATLVGGAGGLVANMGTGGGIAFGDPGGGNQLTTGAGNATLVGGGDGDVVTATGPGRHVLVAGGGAETLNGAAGTGANVFFGGSGADCITGGSGNDLFVAGSGNATLAGGGGTNSYVFVAGGAARTDTILDFNTSRDAVGLFGYGAGPAADAAALASATVANGSTTVALSDGTRIVFVGVTQLNSYNFF